MEDALSRVRFDLERQYNGDGLGILCELETVASAPVYDVRYPYHIVGGGPGTMLLVEDMDVACLNPADGTERDRGTITAVDYDLEQMTVDAAFTNDEIGDWIVLCNIPDAAAAAADQVNNYQNEANGLLAAIATGDTFENIDGSAFRRWNAVVMDNSGTARAITEKLIAQLEARIKAKSQRKPNLFYTTRGISIELQDQLAGLRRFTGETGIRGPGRSTAPQARGSPCVPSRSLLPAQRGVFHAFRLGRADGHHRRRRHRPVRG
jgi:hypothetical protein